MIHVIGIGLDGAEGLSLSVRTIIEEVTVLVGSRRHLGYFPDHPAKLIILSDFDRELEALKPWVEQEVIALLVSGDPLFFGLGRLLLEIFEPEQLAFYPQVSSLQLAFNRVKLPWQDAQWVSVHGRSLEPLIPLLKKGAAKIAVLTDAVSDPSAIARLILSLAWTIDYDCWICENLAGESEKISFYAARNLGELAGQSALDFAPLNVVILHKSQSDREFDWSDLPIVGVPDRAFASFSDRPGLMTKREVRLQILGQLRLQPRQVFWDIGAGTGSVAIEVGRLCPSSQIFAIEKTAIGIQLIHKNCQRFQVANVTAIGGTAPAGLQELPSPDRIFIGGNSGELVPILNLCCEKLKDSGLIVLAFATVEHLGEAIAWLRHHQWHYDLLQVSLARSVAIADAHRFAPLNPVTLVTASPLVVRSSEYFY